MKLALVLAACSAPAGRDVTSPPHAGSGGNDPVAPAGHLWTFDPDGYTSEDAFSESYYGTDVVLFHNRGGFGGELVALEPATGAPLWRRSASWVVHPPGRAEPLWIADDPANTDHAELLHLDPRTGAELARVKVDKPIDSLDGRLAWADGLILAFEYDSLRAIDPTSGATRWTTTAPHDAYLNAPVVANHTIVLLDTTYIAIDAATGTVRWKATGECCTALASPDGRALYVRGAVGKSLRLDWTGKTVGTLAGEVLAVSDGFVAVQEQAQLAVYRHGEAVPVWAKPTTNDKFVSAVALYGDTLFYYADEDSTLWRRDLGSGHHDKIMSASEHFVVSTDAVGTAPAILTAPPQWAPPYLFVNEWGIQAFGVAR